MGAVRHERRCCSTRGRFGVALRDDEAAQVHAVLTRHVLPGRLTHVVAEADLAIRLGLGQEDAPAVVRHLHVIEVGPALGVDGDRRAQVDGTVLERDRPEIAPPLQETRLPVLECPLEAAVVGEPDVVGDSCVDVDGRERSAHDQTRFMSKSGREPVPKRCNAPSGPTALGRWNTQFCHAVSRPKIFVSIVSGPTNR